MRRGTRSGVALTRLSILELANQSRTLPNLTATFSHQWRSGYNCLLIGQCFNQARAYYKSLLIDSIYAVGRQWRVDLLRRQLRGRTG